MNLLYRFFNDFMMINDCNSEVYQRGGKLVLFCLSLCLSANNISIVTQGQTEVKVSTGSRVIERARSNLVPWTL